MRSRVHSQRGNGLLGFLGLLALLAFAAWAEHGLIVQEMPRLMAGGRLW